MISSYTDKYYEYLVQYVDDFDVEYLKNENPFMKSFVFVYNDLPIALMSYSLIYDRIELEYIWVKKEFRNQGIASKLMDKMFDENVNNITLEVRTTNQNALALYEKYGFKVVSRRQNYYGSDDAYLMIREMM